MNRQLIIEYWIEKAYQDIKSAQDDLEDNRLQNAVSSRYYAYFHSFSALLFHEGKQLKKHKQVRAILHRDYVHTGRIERLWGKQYDWFFVNRQKADYQPLVEFNLDEVKQKITQSIEFVKLIEALISISKELSKTNES